MCNYSILCNLNDFFSFYKPVYVKTCIITIFNLIFNLFVLYLLLNDMMCAYMICTIRLIECINRFILS